MTEDRVQEIYDRIAEMTVVLPQDPQLGFNFYKDLLTTVRASQDAVGDFIIEANKDFARVKIQMRGLKKQIQIAGPAQAGKFHEDLMKLEDEADHLKYLLDSLRMKKSNLSGTSSDIRLTVAVMEDQVKLGEVGKPKNDRPTASAERTGYRPPVGAGTVTSVEELAETLTEPGPTPTAPAAVAPPLPPAAPVEALPDAPIPATDAPPPVDPKKAKGKKPAASKEKKDEKKDEKKADTPVQATTAPAKTVTAATPPAPPPAVTETAAAPAKSGGVVEDIGDIEDFLT